MGVPSLAPLEGAQAWLAVDTIHPEHLRVGDEENGHEIDMEFQDVVEDVEWGLTTGVPYLEGNWNANARAEPAQVVMEDHLDQGEVVGVSHQNSCSIVEVEAKDQGACEDYMDRAGGQVANENLREDRCPDRAPYLENLDATVLDDRYREDHPRQAPQGFLEFLLAIATYHCLAVHQGRPHLLPCTPLHRDDACDHAPFHCADAISKKTVRVRTRMGAHVDAKEEDIQVQLLRGQEAKSVDYTDVAGSD